MSGNRNKKGKPYHNKVTRKSSDKFNNNHTEMPEPVCASFIPVVIEEKKNINEGGNTTTPTEKNYHTHLL